MNRNKRHILFGVILVVLSIVFYLIHYAIFRDAHHIFVYLVGDIAFVFIEVLIVTLIIERVLTERDRQVRLEKLNMVIGTFFSEVGTRLLSVFTGADPGVDDLGRELAIAPSWNDKDFSRASSLLKSYSYPIDIRRVDLPALRTFFEQERDFLLRLIENPNLLEHESFTDLLRAVFHVAEELSARPGFDGLPESDYGHLAGDIRRVYGSLVREWIDYMKYLKNSYPYLYSLAVRTNPFDRNASPVVR